MKLKQLPDSAKKWMDGLFGQRLGTPRAPTRKPVQRYGRHQGSKRGFRHAHSPTWRPGVSALAPSQYRHGHFGLGPKALARLRARRFRTGR